MRPPLRSRGGGLLLVGTLVAVAVVAATRLRHWGARPDEIARHFPEDDLVAGPDATLTQAITINVPPERVYPWLVQLGQDKGGFYSYDRLESLLGAGVRNADRIEPAWQEARVGDELLLFRSTSGKPFGLRVQAMETGRRFVAGKPVSKGVGFQWIFDLTPEGGGTRLVVRERYVVPSWPLRQLANLATGGSAVMSQRMLRGVRDRAEQSAW